MCDRRGGMHCGLQNALVPMLMKVVLESKVSTALYCTVRYLSGLGVGSKYGMVWVRG